MGYLDWLPKMELMLQEDSKFNLLGGMCIKKNCKCIYSMGWTDNTKGERLIIYTAQKIEEIFNGRLQFLCSDMIYEVQITQLFHDIGLYHVETSPLICGANQWTGFYMITASVMKELMTFELNSEARRTSTYSVEIQKGKR